MILHCLDGFHLSVATFDGLDGQISCAHVKPAAIQLSTVEVVGYS